MKLHVANVTNYNYCLAGVNTRIKGNKSREQNKAHSLRMYSEKQEYFCSIFAHYSHPMDKVIRQLLGKTAQNNNNNSSGTNKVQCIHNILKTNKQQKAGFQNMETV